MMFDSTAKIASINSFREPDTGTPPGAQKRKPQPKQVVQSIPRNESSDSDDDRHELDTLA